MRADYELCFLQAACHKDRSISKRAIEYIQDIITGLLVEQKELPHFHFNEALLKPFENLLNMETCDIDVQVIIPIHLFYIFDIDDTSLDCLGCLNCPSFPL